MVDKHIPRAAFQITINGKPYGESEDITVLTLVAEEVRRGGERISLHASASESQMQWLAANLTIGDETVVRIVDANDFEDAGPHGCNFCGRDIHDVSKLLEGPAGTICDGCITSFSEAVKNLGPLPLGASIRDEREWTCGICAKQPGKIPGAAAGVVVRNGAAICPECLRAAVEILDTSPGK
jgi:hypothetical protein